MTTVATPVYHCSQVQGRDTPLAADLSDVAIEITDNARSLMEVHSEIVLLLMFDVKPRGFTFVSCCIDITIFNTEINVLFTAAKVCRYDEWTYMCVNVYIMVYEN